MSTPDPLSSGPARPGRTRSIAEIFALVFLTALTLIPALPAAAQDPTQGQPLDLFGDVVDVRVVNVEVVVTDKDGLPVTDLRPGDLKLFVDGEPRAIDYFTEIRGGVAVEPVATEGGGPAGLPSLAPGEPVSTSYLLFIDDFFGIERDRNQVLDALMDELPLLGENDRMAVVAYDGEQVEMLTSWSQSQSALRRVLQDAKTRKGYGLHRFAELRLFENTRSDRQFDRSAFDLSFEEQQYALDLSGQVERSVLAATATLRGFASPPGRKVFLLLSGGWPFSPAQFAVNEIAAQRGVNDPVIPDGPELFNPLARTANLLGYTIYPVDLAGLTTSPATNAARFGPSRAPATPGEVSFAPAAGARSSREIQQEDGMYFLARETGGRALINGLRMAPFERAVQDTRSYYWLGFNAERRADDRKRNIRVQVTRPGLKVRARDSIQDLSREQEVSLAVESALLFGSPPGFDTLPVVTGDLVPAGRKFVDLPLIIAIPTEAMTLVPNGDRWMTRMELRVAAVSSKGDPSEIPVLPLELTLAEKPPDGQFVPYRTQVRLRKQKQKVVIALYDSLGGDLYSNVLDIDPQAKNPVSGNDLEELTRERGEAEGESR
jgi:VWFA-related protein